MNSFYMLRHGQTVANARDFLAGSIDSPLTTLGRQQALALLNLLPHLPQKPSVVIHSPLSRSRDTARTINQNLQLPLVEMAEFAEQCFGDWEENLSWNEAKSLMQRGISPPNGETLLDFQNRVMAGIAKINTLAPSPALIVSHGGVFDALAAYYGCRLPDVENCQLYEFAHIALSEPPPAPNHPSFPWRIHHHFLTANNHSTHQAVTIHDAT